ncbi:MAG: hypothetical protein ACFFBD_08880, partial [Candidatus Hodarchaeota archaeon]
IIEYENVLRPGEVTTAPFGPVTSLYTPGTEILVTFTGSWTLAQNYVKDYFQQLSIITPYADFKVDLPDEDTPLEFKRVFQHLDETEMDNLVPQPTQIHPQGCDITQLKRLIAWTNHTNMTDFLKNSFQGVRASKAKEFLEFINIDQTKDPKQLSSAEIRRIVHEGFSTFTFQRPDGSCLSPITERMLVKGLEKAFAPTFVTAVTRKPSAYSGFPFIVEVAMAYGGSELNKQPGLQLFRYANKIPLLFGEGNDISKRVISGRSVQIGKKRHSIDWKKYGLNINTSPLAIAVSIVSTRIPFPETSKEYIASVDEIAFEILQALRKAASELRTHVRREARRKREAARKSRFVSLASDLSQNLLEMLQDHPEIIPFELDGIQIERALASGIPMNVNYIKPPSPLIRILPNLPKSQIPILRKKGIVSIYDLVRTPKESLVDIIPLSSSEIKKLKEQFGTNIATYSLFTSEETSILKNNGISTLEEAYFFKNPAQPLLQKIKHKLRQPITLLLPDLPPRKISLLTQRGISSIYLFFIWPVEDLSDLLDMSPEAILSLKQNFAFLTELEHSPFSILLEIDEKICKAFDNAEISVEQLYFRDSTNLFTVQELTDLHNQSKTDQEEPYYTQEAGTKIEDLDDKLVNKTRKKGLAQLGINNVYDFLKTPSTSLEEKLTGKNWTFSKKDPKSKFIQNFKSQLGLSLDKTLFEPASFLSDLGKSGIHTVEDLYFNPSFLGECRRLRRILNSSIDFLRPKIPAEIIDRLYHHEITSLVQFYFYPLEKLVKILEKTIEEVIGLKEHLPFAISLADAFYIILESPVAFLEIPPESIKALNLAGVNQIIEFLYWTIGELMDIIQVGSDKLNHAKTNIRVLNKGTLIDQYDKLKKDKKALILADNNYSTFESIYFVANPSSFSVPEITWEDISEIKLQLSAPITRIASLSVEHITPLEDIGIMRVIDFLYFPSKKINQVCPSLSLTEIEQIRRELKLKEHGTTIDALSHLKKSHTLNLEKAGYSTVEDLYFATNQETFKVEGVEWSHIERAKAILRAPLILLARTPDSTTSPSSTTQTKYLPREAAERLMNRGIDTIIKFIYWPNDTLSEILETSEEEIEAWKEEIDTEPIEGLFVMPISILRKLGSTVIATLINNEIDTLGQWFRKSETELSQLIDRSIEDIRSINTELNIDTLVSRTGIPIRKIIFNTDLRRRLSRAGIKYIEDLDRFTVEEDLDSDEVSWDTILKLKNRLNCPVSLFPELRTFSHALKDLMINSINDFLRYPSADLETYLNIPTDKIDELKDGLDLESLFLMLDLPISFMQLPIENPSQFLASNVQTIGDFLGEPDDSTLSQITGLPVKVISTSKSSLLLERVAPLVKAPLKLLPTLTKEEIKELYSYGLSTIGDVLTWNPSELLPQKTRDKILTDEEKDFEAEIEDEKEEITDQISFEQDEEDEDEDEDVISRQETLSPDLDDDFDIDAFSDPVEEFSEEEENEHIENIENPQNSSNEPLSNIEKDEEKENRSDEEEPSKDIESDVAPSVMDPLDKKAPIDLELKIKRYISLQESTNLRNIERILFAPILFAPSLSPTDTQLLITNGILTISDLVETSVRDLASYTGYTLKAMREIQDSLIGAIIFERRTSHSFPLFSLDFLSNKILNLLESTGISSVEELLVLSPDSWFFSDKLKSAWKKISELQEILNSPVTYSPAFHEISPDLFNDFLNHGITRIYQFLTSSLNYLEEICEASPFFLLSLKNKIQPSVCAKLRKKAISITQISKSFKPLIKERGINTIDELLLALYEDDTLASNINVALLNSALSFTPHLPSIHVWKLFTHNINTIAKFLLFPNSILASIVNIEELELSKLKSQITLESIKSRRAQSFPLLEITDASKRISELLESSVLNTPEDIYFVLYRDSSQPAWVINGLTRFIEVFDLPIINIELSTPLSPLNKLKLVDHGVRSIIDFIYWSPSELDSILGLSTEDTINLVKSIDLPSISRKKRKTGLLVSDFYKSPFSDVLDEIGIYSIEGILLSHDDLWANYSPKVIHKINTTKEFLNSSITLIPNTDKYIILQLMEAGISKIYHLLFWSLETLAEKTGLVKSLLSNVKSQIHEKNIAKAKGTKLGLIFPEYTDVLEQVNLKTLEEYYFASSETLDALQSNTQTRLFTRFKILLDLPAATVQLPEELGTVSSKGSIFNLLQRIDYELKRTP